MNQMNGIDAMKEIKKITDIPVVAVTAHAMYGNADDLNKMGFDGYISKPISFNELNAIISKLLNRRQKD